MQKKSKPMSGLRCCLSLMLLCAGLQSVRSQTDTLHLYYYYSQVAPADSTLAKIDKWIASLNNRHVNVNLVAYYSKSDFKAGAAQRLDELFLVLNRKARSLITIESQEPKKGKESQRSIVDIAYKFADGAPPPEKKEAVTPVTRKPDAQPAGGNDNGSVAPNQTTGKEKSSRAPAMSNDEDAWQMKNVIKLNITQLVATNLSLQYECAFHKNISGALGLSYLLPRGMPSFLYPSSTSTTGAAIGLFKPSFNAYSITPEIRFYPFNTKKGAPHGFYLAPYFRYAKYSISADYDFLLSGSVANFGYSMSYQGGTGGIMIGAQWLLGKHVSLDWWIIGGGVGKARIVGEAHSDAANLSDSEQKEAGDQLKADFTGFSLIGGKEPEVETSPTSLKVTTKGLPMFSGRGFGLCLGFAF